MWHDVRKQHKSNKNRKTQTLQDSTQMMRKIRFERRIKQKTERREQPEGPWDGLVVSNEGWKPRQAGSEAKNWVIGEAAEMDPVFMKPRLQGREGRRGWNGRREHPSFTSTPCRREIIWSFKELCRVFPAYLLFLSGMLNFSDLSELCLPIWKKKKMLFFLKSDIPTFPFIVIEYD